MENMYLQTGLLKNGSMEIEVRRNPRSNSLDRLSTLPMQVIDLILNRVPLKEVVRTSALSKTWRYKWMSISQLVFCSTCIQSNYSDAPSSTTSESEVDTVERNAELANFIHANFVNQVLMLHTGIISRFEIRNYLAFGCTDVDRWILYLARKTQVQEFVLVFSRPNPYVIPSSLFVCQNLRELVLGRCVLSLPSRSDMTKGFCKLISLELYSVTLSNDTLASLIFNSPSLRKIKLHHCVGFTQLKISASNLEYFYVLGGGCGDRIYFDHIPELKLACIGPSVDGAQNASFQGSYKTRNRSHKVLRCLINTQMLMLFKTFMEALALCTRMEKFPFTFDRLWHIGLEMNLDDPQEISTLLCMFRRSPCLQSLKLIHHNSLVLGLDKNFWEQRQSREDDIFPKLRRVQMSKFKGTKSGLQFVQFILMKAVLLDSLNVKWDAKGAIGDPQKMQVLQEMMQFQRVSPRAKVTVLS